MISLTPKHLPLKYEDQISYFPVEIVLTKITWKGGNVDALILIMILYIRAQSVNTQISHLLILK